MPIQEAETQVGYLARLRSMKTVTVMHDGITSDGHFSIPGEFEAVLVNESINCMRVRIIDSEFAWMQTSIPWRKIRCVLYDDDVWGG